MELLQGAANFGIGTLALDRTCGISTLFEEETMKFAPGQIVNLKSGGQPMTVVAVDEETVECIWLGDGGEFFREPIPTLALERAYGATTRNPIRTMKPMSRAPRRRAATKKKMTMKTMTTTRRMKTTRRTTTKTTRMRRKRPAARNKKSARMSPTRAERRAAVSGRCRPDELRTPSA
jgi:Uncharacterized small protein (DUF2158).